VKSDGLRSRTGHLRKARHLKDKPASVASKHLTLQFDVKRRTSLNREQARQDVPDNKEIFYNPNRRHHHNDGLSPENTKSSSTKG
jgi:hypothetical protein